MGFLDKKIVPDDKREDTEDLAVEKILAEIRDQKKNKEYYKDAHDCDAKCYNCTNLMC
jgi:hypothetical protein